MKKFLVLSAVALVFLFGCGQKAEKVEAPIETETVVTETPITEAPVEQTVPVEQPQVAPAEQQAIQETTPAPVELGPFVKPDIKTIQQALANAGIYKGKIDGVLGPMTLQSIKDFQLKNGLVVDGKIGPKTWEKLQPYLSQTQTMPETGTGNQ